MAAHREAVWGSSVWHAFVPVAPLALSSVLVLLFATTASAASSYTDSAGDANDAPDVTSVTVSDAAVSSVSVTVAIRNFQALPADARIVVRFDLDRNAGTGSSGAELVVQYGGDGALTASRWDGSQLVPFSSPGVAAAFSQGVLTVTLDRAELVSTTSFGVLAIASRTQTVGLVQVVSTDYAPAGGGTWIGPGDMTFDDPSGDEDAAPDVTKVDVSDASDGFVVFRIATPNYPTLSPDKLYGVDIDLVGRPDSADEVFVTYLSSDGSIEIDREVNGNAMPADPPYRASARYADGVLTLSIHRSELDDAGAFKFSVVTADIVGRGEPEGPQRDGDIEALDIAPNGLLSGKLFAYRLAHAPPVHLALGAPLGIPIRPAGGKRFAVGVVVRRSDTYGVVRAGSVACSIVAGGKRVRATGSFRRGRAQCSFVVPTGRRSVRIRGTISVRAAGASIRSTFTYPTAGEVGAP
jgi:hypothetical protein